MPNTKTAIEIAQRNTCIRYEAALVAAPASVNSGFAIDTDGLQPIHGLRHNVTGDTTGWYIWCGANFSIDKEFFKPVHTGHIYEKHPEIADLLGLPPGYRFLVAKDHVDVWFDGSLLQA